MPKNLVGATVADSFCITDCGSSSCDAGLDSDCDDNLQLQDACWSSSKQTNCDKPLLNDIPGASEFYSLKNQQRAVPFLAIVGALDANIPVNGGRY